MILAVRREKEGLGLDEDLALLEGHLEHRRILVRLHQTHSLPRALSVGWPQEVVSSTPGRPRLRANVFRRSRSP